MTALGKFKIGITFRGFEIELAEDENLRLYLVAGGMSDEDAIAFVHLDLPRCSWRRGVWRGGYTCRVYRTLDGGMLFGYPGRTIVPVHEVSYDDRKTT